MKIERSSLNFHGLLLAQDTLQLDKLTVIYPGKSYYHLTATIEVVALENSLKRMSADKKND